MYFQKQAKYRAKKKKEDAQKVSDKKVVGRERDRLRYLKKKGMVLQEKQLQKTKEAILLDLATLGKRQERMEKQLADVIISNKLFKKKNKK